MASCSSKTVVYKGMVQSSALKKFYLDLANECMCRSSRSTTVPYLLPSAWRDGAAMSSASIRRRRRAAPRGPMSRRPTRAMITSGRRDGESRDGVDSGVERHTRPPRLDATRAPSTRHDTHANDSRYTTQAASPRTRCPAGV